MDFEVLSDLTALDWPKEEKIQVVYHLFSYKHNHQIVLKVDLPRDNPKIATVEGLWKVANWFEAEIYDLFGVIFDGHSDLSRIMLPERLDGLSVAQRLRRTGRIRRHQHATCCWWKNCCARL